MISENVKDGELRVGITRSWLQSRLKPIDNREPATPSRKSQTFCHRKASVTD